MERTFIYKDWGCRLYNVVVDYYNQEIIMYLSTTWRLDLS